ncbi:MAG: PilZ domain-containing protein [Pirellula sp.]
MRIELSDSLRESLASERGVDSPNFFEGRHSARFRCHAYGILSILDDSFQMTNQESPSTCILQNISKSGMGLISHQQLFPEQLVNVQLKCGEFNGRVARIRRIKKNCFEVGLIIVSHELQVSHED